MVLPDADTGPDSVGSPLQSPGSWILLTRWCGVYSWRIDGLWAFPRHIKKWGSTISDLKYLNLSEY
jgi:hypothetical protein